MKVKESAQLIIFIYVSVQFNQPAMDEHLQLLITHYETEQQNLQTLLNECLSEEDYKYAKYYLKNLRLLQKTLFNLYCLLDYDHAKKVKLLQVLSNIKLVKNKNDLDSSLIEKELESLQTKLSILNEKSIIEVAEKHDIENAIIYLLERKINGFKIFILKRDNLYLDFTLAAADVVHIKFTPFNLLNGEYSFDNFFEDSTIETLKRNGFKLNGNANILYIDYHLKNKSTQVLMVFLSQLFFSTLRWYIEKKLALSIY